MKHIAIITVAAFALAVAGLFIGVVHADQAAQATAGSTGQYTVTAPNAVEAEGGNVTAVNLTSAASTTKWQGFYGNVSGSLQLGDGSSVFYNWSGVNFGAVFASPGNDLDFTTVSDIDTLVERTGKDTDYGFDSNDDDSINLTMTGATCAAGTVMSAAAGVTPFNSSGGAGNWTTCIGEDGGGALDDTVFGTNILIDGDDAYNGQQVQYQLMVPVIAANDQYFFYMQI